MKDQIIEAINKYLQRETVVTGTEVHPVIAFEGLNAGHFTHAGFCKEMANEIFEKIEPILQNPTNSEIPKELSQKCGRFDWSKNKVSEPLTCSYRCRDAI